MEGALRVLSYGHQKWRGFSLTTPILHDTRQVRYDVILLHSCGTGEIWSRLPTKRQTRKLHISLCFGRGLEHELSSAILTRGNTSYLDRHTNEDETLVFVLCIDTPPPELESPDPILRSSQSTPVVGVQRPIEFIDSFEQILLLADNEELLILGLKQADTDGKVNRHDPEFQAAGESTVERVDEEDEDQVHMEYQYRQQRQRYLAHPNR